MPELIYAHSDRGFALISQRTEAIQRLCFQCPIDEDVELWSNQQIWDELQVRVDVDDGLEIQQGPIFERTLLRFRSFVAEPMRWGRLVLAGDAAHTVPPTGANARSGAAWMRSTPTARGFWTGSGSRRTSRTG